MSYPSINARPGTAERNLGPVTEALAPLTALALETSSDQRRPHVLELASHPYTHITHWAQRWSKLEWCGSVRDGQQAAECQAVLNKTEMRRSNLHRPCLLDIAEEEDWSDLLQTVRRNGSPFAGVIFLNLIHCCPVGLPEKIFKHLSPKSESGRALLDPTHGWIAGYGPWKNDDESYKTEKDREFEESHIKGTDQSLGLRSIASINRYAEAWGFVEAKRLDMPSGNNLVIWRSRGASQTG